MKTKSILSLLSVIASIAAAPIFGAQAASYSTPGGDASFRRITALGGKLSGVDLTNSLITIAGQQHLLGSIAALAASGLPAALANTPGGWVELDSNGLIPIALLPSTSSSSSGSSLLASSLGKANGPAALDQNGSLSSNFAEATNAPLQRTLANRFADTINAADYGVVCDGSTDNYAAIVNRLIPAINASSGGAQVDWPGGGKCLVSAQVTATIGKNVLFRGRGPISTYFYFTSNTSNGFHFIASNGAAIEWEETGIDTAATTPSADALMIEGYNPNNGSLPHNNAGWVVVDHNQIQGNFWTGIHLRNLNFATASYNRITAAAGPAVTTAYPSPNNLATDPVASIIGSSANATTGTSVGTAGIYLEGTGSDYLIDPKLIGNSIVNGTAQVQMDDTQGGYMAANSLFNGMYGVRSFCAVNVSCENLTFTTGYVYDQLDDFYLEGMDGYQVTGNFLWVSSASSSYPAGGPAGVFVRDGDGGVVSGNTIQAPASSSAASIRQWAWFVGNDSANSKPWSFGPNSILGGGGPIYIGNDANTSGLMAQGNVIAEAAQPSSGTSIVDATMTAANPIGSNNYVFNATPYADARSDGAGNLSFRRSVRCGGPYDTCTLTQIANGTTVFSSDASGDVTSTGQSEQYAASSYREFTSVVFGTVATGATMQLTPGGAFPVFAATTASGAANAGGTTLAVATGAIFAAGMGLDDTTSGATATVRSVSSNTLTLAAAGLSAAVASGDALVSTLPLSAELGLGNLNANNGTLTARNGYCVSGSTRFAADLTQIYGGSAASGTMTVNTVAGTVTSGLTFSGGRDATTGTPYVQLTNASGAPATCRFSETFASSPL